jgi:hypothetical protein
VRVGLVLAAVLLLASTALAQVGGSTQDRFFRIEWKPYGLGRATPSLEGYVHNDHRYRIGGVRLKVEALDDAGKTVGETQGWVYGNIPSGGKTYFVVAAPKGAVSYRLSVLSFHLVALERQETESP